MKILTDSRTPDTNNGIFYIQYALIYEMKNIRFEETHEIVQIEDQNMAQERVNIDLHCRPKNFMKVVKR